MTPAMALWPAAPRRGSVEQTRPAGRLGGSFSPLSICATSWASHGREEAPQGRCLRPFFPGKHSLHLAAPAAARRGGPTYDAARHVAATAPRDAGSGLDAAPARVESRRAPQWLHPCVGGTTAEGGGRTSEEQCVVRGKVLRPTVRLPSRPLQLRGAAAGHATTEQPQVGQPDSAPVRAVHCLRHHTRLGAVRTHHGAWAGL